MKKLEKEEKELDMGISSKTTEEKEEYQLYAWNKKKEKYVPVGKPQPRLNLCKNVYPHCSNFQIR